MAKCYLCIRRPDLRPTTSTPNQVPDAVAGQLFCYAHNKEARDDLLTKHALPLPSNAADFADLAPVVPRPSPTGPVESDLHEIRGTIMLTVELLGAALPAHPALRSVLEKWSTMSGPSPLGAKYCDGMQPGGPHQYGHLCNLQPGHQNPMHACACGHMWTGGGVEPPRTPGYDPDCDDCNRPGGPSTDHMRSHLLDDGLMHNLLALDCRNRPPDALPIGKRGETCRMCNP